MKCKIESVNNPSILDSVDSLGRIGFVQLPDFIHNLALHVLLDGPSVVTNHAILLVENSLAVVLSRIVPNVTCGLY
jgi:hypothetical protein